MMSSYYPNSVTHPEGPDYDDRPEQPRCQCGAFLPWQPTTPGGSYLFTPEYPLIDQDGNYVGVEQGRPFEREYPPIWTCKRCGKDN